MIAPLVAGCLVGFGWTLVLAGSRVAAPDLRDAVTRLANSGTFPVEKVERTGARRAVDQIALALKLDRFSADLAITGMTPARVVMEKLGYGILGLLFPIFMASILTLSGIAVPIAIPVFFGLALGIGLSFLPEIDLRRRALRARMDMRRTVCTFLELVALERAADAGAVEALERAGAIGDGPGFEHLRNALLRARLEGRTPWQQLAELAQELDVPEIGDVADIMRLSGEDGASVMPTLRARAQSLRTWLLNVDVTEANEASERMSIPVALLGIAFMVLLGFPALWRIMFG